MYKHELWLAVVHVNHKTTPVYLNGQFWQNPVFRDQKSDHAADNIKTQGPYSQNILKLKAALNLPI